MTKVKRLELFWFSNYKLRKISEAHWWTTPFKWSLTFQFQKKIACKKKNKSATWQNGNTLADPIITGWTQSDKEKKQFQLKEQLKHHSYFNFSLNFETHPSYNSPEPVSNE